MLAAGIHSACKVLGAFAQYDAALRNDVLELNHTRRDLGDYTAHQPGDDVQPFSCPGLPPLLLPATYVHASQRKYEDYAP